MYDKGVKGVTLHARNLLSPLILKMDERQALLIFSISLPFAV